MKRLLLSWVILAGSATLHADTFDDLILEFRGGYTTDFEYEKLATRGARVALRQGHLGIAPGQGLKLSGELFTNDRDTGSLIGVVVGRTLYVSALSGKLAYAVELTVPPLPPETNVGLALLANAKASEQLRAAVNQIATVAEKDGEIRFQRPGSSSEILMKLGPDKHPQQFLVSANDGPVARIDITNMRPDSSPDLSLPFPESSYRPATVQDLQAAPQKIKEMKERVSNAVGAAAAAARGFLDRLMGGGRSR